MAVTTNAGELSFAERRRAQPLVIGWWHATWHFTRKKPLAAFGGAIVVIMLVTGIFAHWIAPYGYDVRDYHALLQTPSLHHLLGTDDVGRDIFSRIVYGARVSVIIGFGSVIVAQVLATLLGVPAGYFGGKFDLIVQRIVDMWIAFPSLILLITLASIFGTPTSPTTILPGVVLQPADVRMWEIVFALGLILTGGTSRVVRSAVLSIRHDQYMEAARALGASNVRILWRHVLPNVFPTILVLATGQLGAAILIEASLSFLQFGIPPPVPAWGSMLSDNATLFVNRAPLLAVWPGLAISLVVFGFNMFGDGLRDVLDPRMRGSS
jgi:peptide/nickel transport system permease protein